MQERHPTIDYQTGSIRDDFDFGQLVLIRASLLHEYAAKQHLADYKWAGFYDLRLYISRKSQIFHLNEYLYTQVRPTRARAASASSTTSTRATARCR